MKKFLQKKLKEQKGMTLIELLAVIVILAIIAAIAIPAIGNIIENSRYSGVKSDAANVLAAAQLYYSENPEGPTVTTSGTTTATTLTVQILKDEGFLESEGKIPVGSTIAENVTAKALGLTTTAITFSGSKKVEFKAASTKTITGDTTKGNTITGTKELAN